MMSNFLCFVTYSRIILLFLSGRTLAFHKMGGGVTNLGFLRMHAVEANYAADRNQTHEIEGIVDPSAPVNPEAPQLERSNCGQPHLGKARIIGGSVAAEDMYPWQCLLMITMDKGHAVVETNCGGALISPTWVLTVAHCLGMTDGIRRVAADQVVVVLGAHDLLQSDEDDTRIRVPAVGWQQHESWNPHTSMEYDLGFVKIPDMSKRAPNFMPICLPSKNTVDLEVDCVTLGWGLTAGKEKGGRQSTVLKALSTQTINPNACKLSSATMAEFYRPSMICINPQGGKHTVCHGDSGGPLFTWEKGKYVLIGLTSFGSHNGCEAPEPAAFTRITRYTKYICSKTGVCS